MSLYQHTGVLYEKVLLTTVVIEEVPTVNQNERIEISGLGHGFYQIILHYGFMQGVNISSELSAINEKNLLLDMNNLNYITKKVEIMPGRKLKGMATWRDYLFVFMFRNTQDITSTYHLPDKQTMIIGLKAGI